MLVVVGGVVVDASCGVSGYTACKKRHKWGGNNQKVIRSVVLSLPDDDVPVHLICELMNSPDCLSRDGLTQRSQVTVL